MPRPSEFGRILDARMHAPGMQAETARAMSHPVYPIHGLGRLSEQEPLPGNEDAGIATDLLAHTYPDEPVLLSQQEPDCTPFGVSQELRLLPDLTPEDLNRIRRAFALSNHPDRVPPSRRDLATRRMTVANALIDQALHARRTPAR